MSKSSRLIKIKEWPRGSCGHGKSLVLLQTKEGFFCKILFDFVLDGNAFAAN